MTPTKNATRISSLLGTWTAETRVRTVIGHYEMLAYFVVHLMPDPLRGYGCSLDSCREIDNQVCEEQDSGNSASRTCVSMEDRVVEWSDVSAFLYFGARVDAGVPFNVHQEHTTGGWIGPLSMILAQNYSESPTELDRYVVRYVDSPSTPYLHMDPNCSLFAEEDFEHYMGRTAVQETVRRQAHANHGDDPYAPFLETCDNGNVKPILPLFDFAFVSDEHGEEKIQVKLDYKILAVPHKKDIMYKVFPTMQERTNKKHGEFHISGPYCYGDDPKRGYTFDFSYDSVNANERMTLVHGCIEGLPCLPAADEISIHGSATDVIHVDIKTATFGSEMLLTFMAYILSVALLASFACNYRLSRQVRNLRLEPGPVRLPPHDVGPYGDLGDEEDFPADSFSEPLLPPMDYDSKEVLAQGSDGVSVSRNDDVAPV